LLVEVAGGGKGLALGASTIGVEPAVAVSTTGLVAEGCGAVESIAALLGTAGVQASTLEMVRMAKKERIAWGCNFLLRAFSGFERPQSNVMFPPYLYEPSIGGCVIEIQSKAYRITEVTQSSHRDPESFEFFLSLCSLWQKRVLDKVS